MKYLRTFLLAIQSQLQNRGNLLGWFLVVAVPPVIFVAIWLSILGNKQNVGGFSKSDFIVYYFFQSLSWYIVGGTFSRWYGDWIKNGTINKTLLKPYNVILEIFLREQAWKVMSLIISLPIVVVLIILLHNYINIHLTLYTVFLTIFSLALGGINFALLEAIVGNSAFWITYVWPIADFETILLDLFGGLLVPIALMPKTLQQIAFFLPFKYIFYTPTSIFLQKSKNPIFDIFIQLLFILMLFIFFRILWSLGIRKYESVGG